MGSDFVYCGDGDCNPTRGDAENTAQEARACDHITIRMDRRVWHDHAARQSYIEIRLRCEDCKAPLLFHGLPVGELGDGPCTSATKGIVRLPIYAEGEPHAHERTLS